MAIESVYQIAGRGTVATGTVERGFAKKGEKVDLVGYGKKESRFVSLHISYVMHLAHLAIFDYSVQLLVWKLI